MGPEGMLGLYAGGGVVSLLKGRLGFEENMAPVFSGDWLLKVLQVDLFSVDGCWGNWVDQSVDAFLEDPSPR
jgi:hypothetical protein